MTPKQSRQLFNFIYCAIIVAFFAIVGGCTRACSNKLEKDHIRREKENERKAREAAERLKNPRRYNMINFQIPNSL